MEKNNQVNEEIIKAADIKKRHKGNFIIEEGNIIKVFTNGVELVPFIFDIDDRALVEQYTICRNGKGYAVAYDKSRGKKVFLHRVVMDMLDKPSKDFIDHIDGDKNNNKKSNLRICHNEDASNQRNVHYVFPNGEKVQRYRTPNDTFVLRYTDGIMPYIEFEYYKYADLLEHYDSLWRYGFEIPTKSMLAEHKLNCIYKIEDTKSRKEQKRLQADLNELEYLSEQVERAYNFARSLKKNNLLPKGMFFVNKKLKIIGDIDKSPKETFELGTIPEVIYFGSHHDKLIAGNHFFKPSGENIY